MRVTSGGSLKAALAQRLRGSTAIERPMQATISSLGLSRGSSKRSDPTGLVNGRVGRPDSLSSAAIDPALAAPHPHTAAAI